MPRNFGGSFASYIHSYTFPFWELAFASKQGSKWRSRDVVAVYFIVELAMLTTIGLAIIFLYPSFTMHWMPPVSAALVALLMSGSLVTWSLLRNHYRRCVTGSEIAAMAGALSATLRAAAFMLSVLFVVKASGVLSRASIMWLISITGLLTMIGRTGLSICSHRLIASGRMFTDRTMIIGEQTRLSLARESVGFFDRLQRDGVKVVAVESFSADVAAYPERLAATVIDRSRSGQIDSVVLLPTASTIDVAEQLCKCLAETPLTVHVVPFVQTSGPHASTGTSIGGQSSILVANSPSDTISSAVKRAIDILLSAMMLFLLAPLMIGVAIAIRWESKGPALFRQTRQGYGNCHFKVYKFRSMRVMEDGTAFRQATKNDSRITRVGHFIRKSNVDELPQLLNVLLGDMSLVGPRPHPIELNKTFATRIRMFNRRHNIRPGITGWAQINGFRGETDTDEKMIKRVEHDLWYVDNYSLILDLRILLFTLVSSASYRNAG